MAVPFLATSRTGKPYRGVNVLLLWSSPYSSPFWLTFKQALDLKGSVRKGEKRYSDRFLQAVTKPERTIQKATGRKEGTHPFCALLLHRLQCRAVRRPYSFPRSISQQPATEIDTDETCEASRNRMGQRHPALHLSGEHEHRAYYRPSSDSVHMPARFRFVDSPHYYSTLFHELVHSTGHESRLQP